MPIYEYACRSCGREFEELVRGDERPACPSCGNIEVEKQLSAPAAHTSSGQSACPAQNECAMAHRCGQNCGHGH
jgi:putative FmdB family regulatory protein